MVSREVSIGNLINLGAVLIAFFTLWVSHQKDVETEIQHREDESQALKALGERVGDLSERLQAISLGNTQRFTSLDDGISGLSKRFDSLTSVVQAIGDRLTIQEAKTQALQEELRTIVNQNQKHQ